MDVLTEGDFFKGRVGSVKVVVDNDVVTGAGLACVLDLGEGSGKTSLDGILAIGAAPAQSAAEGGHVGWGYEDIDGVQISLLDLPDALAGVSVGGGDAGRRTWESMSSTQRLPDSRTARMAWAEVP